MKSLLGSSWSFSCSCPCSFWGFLTNIAERLAGQNAQRWAGIFRLTISKGIASENSTPTELTGRIISESDNQIVVSVEGIDRSLAPWLALSMGGGCLAGQKRVVEAIPLLDDPAVEIVFFRDPSQSQSYRSYSQVLEAFTSRGLVPADPVSFFAAYAAVAGLRWRGPGSTHWVDPSTSSWRQATSCIERWGDGDIFVARVFEGDDPPCAGAWLAGIRARSQN